LHILKLSYILLKTYRVIANIQGYIKSKFEIDL
jgi:hypothetical protein